MRSVTITIFILINTIKQNFGILSNVHNWQFDIPINFSKHQYDGMCTTIVSQCIGSIKMISFTSSTTSHLHISTDNDWECLGRVSKCFLNAQLSTSSTSHALIVSTTNPNTYIGWHCMVQQIFITKNNHIKVFIQNCSQNWPKQFVKSNNVKIFHYEPIRSFQTYATHKFVFFITILGITAYTIIVYLIFCIILAQYEKEIESYEQSSERKIKQINSRNHSKSSKFTQHSSPATMISMKRTGTDQRFDYSLWNTIKYFEKWTKKKRSSGKSVKESKSSTRSISLRRQQISSMNFSTSTSISQIGTNARSANELAQKMMQKTPQSKKHKTFSQSTMQHITMPYANIKNKQSNIQIGVLKGKIPLNREISNFPLSKINPSPRPMIVQIVHNISNGVEISSKRIRSFPTSTTTKFKRQERKKEPRL
uniref:Uncharacterized protein n=1 Tax=Wuchereria bancrofti TaxID=6293 RepID=A0AAF5PRB4_WUCBA